MSDDLIKRSDTIKELKECIITDHEAISEYPDDILKYNSGLLTAIQTVYDLHSADRPQGEWKPKNHHTDYCSNCGFEETQWRTVDYNYCPSCGARMKGAYDED